MSLRAITWAFEQHETTPTQRLLLLAYADCANQDDEAWPKIERLIEAAPRAVPAAGGPAGRAAPGPGVRVAGVPDRRERRAGPPPAAPRSRR